MGIVVKCFQSNRSSVQSLQSPHPTHHIFNFTTSPIGHTPNTKRSLSMPSERTVTIRSHTPQTALMKRFNKRPQKKKNQSLSPHPASTARKRATRNSPTSTQKIKVNVNATATQFLTPTPSPQHRPTGKYHLQFHKPMASRMPRNT